MSHIKDVEEERKLVDVMMKAWSGFAKDPVGGLKGMGWPIYENVGEFCLLGVLCMLVNVYRFP